MKIRPKTFHSNIFFITSFVFLFLTKTVMALSIQGLETRATGQFSGSTGSIEVKWGVWDNGSSMPAWTKTVIYRCDNFNPFADVPTSCNSIYTRNYDNLFPAWKNSIYYDASAVQGKYYWYKVKVCNGASCTGFSRPSNYSSYSGDSMTVQGAWKGNKPVAPMIPNDVYASKGTYSNSVKVYWYEEDPRMTDSFLVLRCSDRTVGSCVVSNSSPNPSASDRTYLDRPPKTGKLYYYRVSATAVGRTLGGEPDFSYSTESLPSFPAFGWADSKPANVPALPSIPTKIYASREQPSSITVAWSSANRATWYELFRRTGKDGAWKRILSKAKTDYQDGRVSSADLYYYKVKACNGGGCSGFSKTVTGSLRIFSFSNIGFIINLLLNN